MGVPKPTQNLPKKSLKDGLKRMARNNWLDLEARGLQMAWMKRKSVRRLELARAYRLGCLHERRTTCAKERLDLCVHDLEFA